MNLFQDLPHLPWLLNRVQHDVLPDADHIKSELLPPHHHTTTKRYHKPQLSIPSLSATM